MRRLIAVLGIVISIGAIYLALRDVDLGRAWAAFGQIQPGIFVLGLIPWTVAIGSRKGSA